MKISLSILLTVSLILFGCRESEHNIDISDQVQPIIVDSSFADTVKKNIQFLSDRYFSDFKTHLQAEFYHNGIQVDSVDDRNFEMVSWYYLKNDTIDLVAHIGELENIALLIRFTNNKTFVRLFRSSHEGIRLYFKIKQSDTLSNFIEVPPIKYNLVMSGIPDSIRKQVVYGYVDMKSKEFYDSRDSKEKRHRIDMKFYFRSQYRGLE